MWEKKKESQPQTTAIAPESLEKISENQFDNAEKQEIAPTKTNAAEILPKRAELTPEEQEKQAEEASKTNIKNDIMVNLKAVACDLTALLLLIVLACGLAVGIAIILLQTYLLVGLLILAIMSPVSAGVVRIAYLFFKQAQDDAGNPYNAYDRAYDRLKSAVKKATRIGRV